MKAPVPKERAIQRQIVSGLRAMGLRVVRVGNGGEHKGTEEQRIRRAMAKRMDGEVAGFPDLLIMTRDGRAGFLEVKRPSGSMGDRAHLERQAVCHAILAEDHFPVAVARTFDEAVEHVTAWGFSVRRWAGRAA